MTTPITFEKKILELEAQKMNQEKLKESLKLQIVDALLAEDMVSVKSITDQLNAVISMDYDQRIAAVKARQAKVLQIPEKDPDHQESILSDNHVNNIEDEEIIELIRRRKVEWWNKLKKKEYKIREAHFDNSNIGKVEEIDLSSAPELLETPAAPTVPEQPETPVAPETALETNKKAPLKDKAELKRLILEQFKTKEELKFAPYEIFAKKYNVDENNKYTITTSITWLFSSLGLKEKNIKELRNYLYGEADSDNVVEKADSDKVVEKADSDKDIEKADSNKTVEEVDSNKTVEEVDSNKTVEEVDDSNVVEEADDNKNSKEKKPRGNESKERWNKEATLQILSKLEKIWIFNPEKHLGNPFIKFAKTLKANKDLINWTNDEYLINKIDSLVASPITLTTYLWWLIKTWTEKEYQLLLWKRYCLVENSINGHKLHDINVKIMDKERELLAWNPDALKQYNLDRAKERQEAINRGAKNIDKVIDKEWWIKPKSEINESDDNSLHDKPTTPIIGDQI